MSDTGWSPSGEPNVYRVWVCDECGHAFPDKELRRNPTTWGHICQTRGQLCESHLTPHLPEATRDE